MKSIKEIMNLDVSNLAKSQHDALKEHTLAVLNNVKNAIQQEKYSDVSMYTSFSPAGDECGFDTNYIDFGYDQEPIDILEAVEMLINLKQASKQ